MLAINYITNTHPNNVDTLEKIMNVVFNFHQNNDVISAEEMMTDESEMWMNLLKAIDNVYFNGSLLQTLSHQNIHIQFVPFERKNEETEYKYAPRFGIPDDNKNFYRKVVPYHMQTAFTFIYPLRHPDYKNVWNFFFDVNLVDEIVLKAVNKYVLNDPAIKKYRKKKILMNIFRSAQRGNPSNTTDVKNDFQNGWIAVIVRLQVAISHFLDQYRGYTELDALYSDYKPLIAKQRTSEQEQITLKQLQDKMLKTREIIAYGSKFLCDFIHGMWGYPVHLLEEINPYQVKQTFPSIHQRNKPAYMIDTDKFITQQIKPIEHERVEAEMDLSQIPVADRLTAYDNQNNLNLQAWDPLVPEWQPSDNINAIKSWKINKMFPVIPGALGRNHPNNVFPPPEHIHWTPGHAIYQGQTVPGSHFSYTPADNMFFY